MAIRCRWSLALGLCILGSGAAHGQALRYDYHRNLTSGAMRYREDRIYRSELGDRAVRKDPPKYATLRIGPFYSTAAFTQSAGYSYVRTRGNGTDFLYGNRRGRYLKDGSDFPLISTLDLRNYVLITEHMDLDLSVSATYAQYPLDTREDEFYVDFMEEGFFGTLSWAFDITPFLGATVFDRFTYRTDYIDQRGMEDRYGGQRYEYIDNEVGSFLDWRLAKDKSVIGSVSREDFLPSDEEFSDQERITYREGLEYRQVILPGFLVGARAAYAQTRYTASDRENWNQEDYAVFADVNEEAGIAIRMTPFTRIRVGVGYSAGYTPGVAVGSSSGGDLRGAESRQSGTLTGFGSLTTNLRKDLSHALDFSHGLRAGFYSDYETFTAYGYHIDWQGALESASFFTRVTEVEPSGDGFNRYRDWATGVRGAYPLIRYATLLGSSTYTVRSNMGEAQGADVDLELQEDYTTWSSRIGTSLSVTKSISFLPYYEHVERMSDSAELEYTRDIFEALFTYVHAF